MSASARSSNILFRRVVTIGIISVLVGAAVLFVAIGLDWDGFAGGLAQGAGVGAMIVGGYFWGFGNGIRRRDPRGGWLPSRDVSE